MTGGSMFYIDPICNGLDNLPDGDAGLRAELWKRLGEEGVGTLAEELRSKDPLTSHKSTSATPEGDPRLGGLHRFGEAVLLFQDGWQAEPILSDEESRVDEAARGIIFKNRPQGAEYDG